MMGSRRRPLGRSSSGNGSPGSDGEDYGPLADTRPDRRNYLLSIRPEHRSTFCAIIAQLTEETQPLFETTLKSYAVSEDADAKFTCVVTGYPQPDLTWYKDDQEMDRYCGLPKYEIFHHGNRHTLQLYRCTEDDAAIYQASARNSKGIASCSGVLEVGTMSEYRIHQRWFARLKRNAEAKLREIDQSRKRGKENVEMDQLRRRASPDRFQRKRRLTGEIGMQSGTSLWDKEEVAKVRIPDGKPRLGEGDPAKIKETPLNPTALFSNNFITGRKEGGVTTNGDASLENGEPNGEENANGFLSYIYEKVEKMKAKPTNKELSAKKKKKKEREGSPPNANQDISQPEGGTQQRKNVLGQKTRSPIGSSQSVPPVANGERMEAEPIEPPHQVETEKPLPLSASDGSYFSLKEMYFDSEGKPESERERPEVKAVKSKANRLKVDGSVVEKTPPDTSTALKKAAREERKNESCKEKEGKGKETVQTKNATRPSVETSGDLNTTSSQHPNQPAETVTVAQKPIPPSRLPKAAKAANRSAPRTNVQPPNRTLDTRTRVPSPFLKEDRARLVDGHTRETGLIEPLPADAKPTQQTQRPLRGCTEIEKAKPLQGTKQDLQAAVSEGQLDTQGPREPSGNLVPVLSTDKNLQTPASHLRGQINREGKSITLRTGLHGDTETKGSKETPDPSPETHKVVATQSQKDNQKTSLASQNLPSVSVDISQPTEKEDLILKEDEGKHSPLVRNAEVKHKPTPSHRSEELVIHELPSQEVVLERRPTDRVDQVAPPMEEASEEEFVEASQGNRPGLETDLGLEGKRLPTVAARPLVVPDIVETSFPSHIVPEKPPPTPTVLLSPTLHEPQAPPQLSPVREGCAERNQSVAHLLMDVKKESGTQSPVRLTGPVLEQPVHSAAAEEFYVEEEFVTPPEYEHGALPVGQKAGIQMRERERTTSERHLAPVPLSHPEAAVEEVEESAEQAQHENLVTSLKNYLLLLLKMSTEGEKKKGKSKQEAKAVEEKKPPMAIPKHLTDVGIAGLTPRTSRKIFERVETNQLFQTAESLPLTPRTSRKLTGMINQELLTCKESLVAESEAPVLTCVPSIVVGSASGEVAEHSDQCPAIPGEAVVALPSATPQELALGARRKIFLPKAKQGDETEGPMGLDDQAPRTKRESPTVSPKQGRRSPALLATPGPASPPEERRSPTQARKMATLEVPKMYEEIVEESKEVADGSLVSPENLQGNVSEGQGGESQKANDPFKAPQVIRKIRAEQFSDASGNLKLWCQFFNILSDSKLTWFKDEMPVADVRRSAGDEGQAALAIVQVSKKDCGLYQCTIRNDYGTDTTDFLLTAEVLSGFIFKEEIEAGEEIEMTPMVFAKGLADSGFWGDKLFGRIMVEHLEVGQGFQRKACRARAIYGLEPVFESGHTGIIKVRNLIAFGGRSESTLVEKNYDVAIQECKIQNSSREYCKIFAAEARAVPDFGLVPEIIPLYLIYRPANNIPYATMEEDLPGRFERYCGREQDGGGLAPANPSEVGQKCSTFQHWLYQWTNGNILVTDLEGVGWKVTNVRIATKTKGYQGLKESCCPHLLDHFAATHLCNRHCELMALKSLEVQPPAAKVKGSRSPITSRKPSSSAQSSPQLQKKGPASPQASRKGPVSPKSARRCPENTAELPPGAQLKAGEPSQAGQLH